MDELAHVTQPALIITGEQDRLTPPKYGEFLRERLPNATAVVVPEAGHYVMDEAPDAVAAAISSWLRTQNPVAPMP
ncbi:MAG TPA: alpha/beta hydrolase, partial [Ktedonobacterales bacterium]